MPDGQLGHCRCCWPLGGVTMAGFWAIGGQQLQGILTAVSMGR